MVGRYTAGAMNPPFFPLLLFRTDPPVANPLIRPIQSPYGDERILRGSRRCGRMSRSSTRMGIRGGARRWTAGLPEGGSLAADRVIVVVEELVDEAVIRADPNWTIILASSSTPSS
jgi:glutaconate CoA-transferase subunit A